MMGVALNRKAITAALNGAEFLELEARAGAARLTMPAYVRTVIGLEPWIARGREMQGRLQVARSRRVMALDRMAVTITVTEAELAALREQAREGQGTTLFGETVRGLSIPQFVRARCGFKVRWTSLPNTGERDREEDDAWKRLERLGLNPQEYFQNPASASS
jgi:hypothetical protein